MWTLMLPYLGLLLKHPITSAQWSSGMIRASGFHPDLKTNHVRGLGFDPRLSPFTFASFFLYCHFYGESVMALFIILFLSLLYSLDRRISWKLGVLRVKFTELCAWVQSFTRSLTRLSWGWVVQHRCAFPSS